MTLMSRLRNRTTALIRFCGFCGLLLGTFCPVSAQEPAEAGENSEAAVQSPSDEERHTHPFDREWLVNHARELSQREFSLEVIEEGNPLTTLDYDDYRHINFDRDATIWAQEGRNFSIDLFHPGFIFKTPVYINLVVGGVSRRILYTTDIFRYGEQVEEVKAVEAKGYSGFRVYHPVTADSGELERISEFLVFQGASYFRAAGKNQFYGLSSRGIAINTARPQGEEFPYFTEFWIERPDTNAEKIIIHALLDSPSLTGAYTFNVSTGDYTVMDVDSVLFMRETVENYGIAPLTSMFLFNAMNRSRFDDYRPAVHDSDGLLIKQRNGETIWRPLANPKQLQVSSFMSANPEGFGLMQRHRHFSDFEDPEAHYEQRASLWIEPLDDWGEGHVELVEIPADREVYDNIVAFWQPATPMTAGESYHFRYRMHWGAGSPAVAQTGKILDTQAGKDPNTTERLFVIDYSTDRDITEELDIDAQTSAGLISDARGHVVGETGHYRIYLKLDPGDAALAELQLRLKVNDEPWGETWLYRWER